MTNILSELIGTMVLVTLGNGVVANVMLSKTKGYSKNEKWLTITIGWALAVFMAMIISSPYSGGHLNPCVTIGFAMIGKLSWSLVPFYIVSQFIGAMLGSSLVWILYKDYFLETNNERDKLSVFVTTPAIRNFCSNFFSEFLSTFLFIFISFFLNKEGSIFIFGKKYLLGLGAMGAIPSSLVVLGIVLSLGGTTGAALNPARDLGSRIIHYLLPIPGKGDSDWSYALVPVLGPLFGSIVASALYLFLKYE
ncbi:MIP/aquaporin family protein [Blattabacterium cuenoti]|uniref:MIP/aquaporin family protein n=1 Tax=Blattabacterium cuenoti TaxID=1653831 RepID=UPI00163C96BE|nr:MIP/aquaporin family protein [Blattabacterium cuenoti]